MTTARLPGNPSGPLEARALSIRLSGEARPILRDLDLSLREGDVSGVCGRSGCGKSTLVHTISGLVPWLRPAESHGSLRLAGEALDDLDPGQRAHLIATCLDRPDAQLFLATVRQEIAAACGLHRRTGGVEALAEQFGISKMLDRRITELSSGQRQRVALSCAFAAAPRPVLLDEPTAHLDEAGVGALARALHDAAGRNGSFLVVEQAGWRVAEAVHGWSVLERGRLHARAEPAAPRFRPPSPCGDRPVVSCQSVSVRRGNSALLDDVTLDVHEGEVVLLSGANGSGKSTFAQVLAGLRRPARGVVSAVRPVGFMLPSAELQLFSATVADEVSTSGVNRQETARVLRRHRLEHLAARAPWTLSRGERQRLVHAVLDLQRPAVMIVDEPAQGLDPEDLKTFVDLVHRRAEKGRAYVIISHRAELAGAAHRSFVTRDGTVAEVTA